MSVGDRAMFPGSPREDGISQRDFYALAYAMVAKIAMPMTDASTLAENGYKFANAMLKERDK